MYTTEWVQLVVDPCASEAKRDEAFGLLLFTHLLLGSTGAELLWPFLLGTLLRRVRVSRALSLSLSSLFSLLSSLSLFLSSVAACCGLRN
jgi:hypothetical protein